MLLLSYTVAALAVLVALLVTTRVRSYRRLSHVGGPSAAGWTDLWMIRAQASGQMHLVLWETIKRYGQ